MLKNRVARIASLFVLLVLAACFAPAALAESSLGVSATVTPEALTEAGRVNINIRLANNGPAMLEDVTMIARNIDETLGNLEPGDKKAYNITNFKVAEEEVGGEVSFQFFWVEDGEEKTLEYPIKIQKKTLQPELKAERTLSANTGAAGDVITLTYALQNTGEVPLTDVVISDPVLPADVTVGTLDVGSATVRVTQEITLQKTVVSVPVITASANGTPLTVELESQEIMLADAKLEMAVSAGAPTAEGTPLTVQVSNTGNVDFISVALLDDQGSALTAAFSLPKGGSQQVQYLVNPTEPRDVVISATATYGTATAPLVVTAPAVTVTPAIQSEDIVVELSAKPVKSQFDEPTEVVFAVKVVNKSPVELYHLVISEESAGRLESLDTVEIGAQTVNVRLLVDQTRDVVFTASFEDELGNSYSAVTAPVPIEIGAAIPEESPAPEQPVSGSSRWLTWLLVVIIALFVVAAACLAYVLTQQRKRKEQQREADELDRLLSMPSAGSAQNTQAGRTARTQAPRQTERFEEYDLFENRQKTGTVSRGDTASRQKNDTALRGDRSARQKTGAIPAEPQRQDPQAGRTARGPVLRDDAGARVLERRPQQPKATKQAQDEDLFEREFMNDDPDPQQPEQR